MAKLLKISTSPRFAGSKKKRRAEARALDVDLGTFLDASDEEIGAYLSTLPVKLRDRTRVSIEKARLSRVYELSRLIKDDEELDRYLAALPDDMVRAEVRKLIEPFLLFETKKKIIEPTTTEIAKTAPVMATATVPPGPTANADGVFAWERDFREHERRLVEKDVPHEEQVRATAMFLARSFELTVLRMIRDEGFEVFRQKTRSAQAEVPKDGTRLVYSDDDLRRMYGFVLRELDAREGRRDMHVARG